MNPSPRILPSAEELKSILDYSPETGEFRWKIRVSSGCAAGSTAGSVKHHGYRCIVISGKKYYAHRLAWRMTYGEDPPNFIDHINCDESDNRIANLRKATHSQNMQNQGALRTNKSGVKGVCWASKDKRWKAQITLNGKVRHLGHFTSISDAASAYAAAALVHHGEFAKIDAPALECQHASS